MNILDLHMIFVDYKEAQQQHYDKNHGRCYLTFGNTKRENHNDTIMWKQKPMINFKNVLSPDYKITNGLCQGYAKSPLLFNLALESDTKSATNRMYDTKIHLPYAEGIVIIEKTEE